VGQQPSYGGVWAAPVFGRVAKEALEIMGVPRIETEAQPADSLVSVPNVINLDVHDAEELLLVHGLRVQADGSHGFVVDQTPPPGARVKPDTTVVLTVDDETPIGDRPVKVPDLRGRSMKDAAMILSREGLRIVIEGTGYVVSQEPKAGATLLEGEAVTVRFAPP